MLSSERKLIDRCTFGVLWTMVIVPLFFFYIRSSSQVAVITGEDKELGHI